MDMNFVTFNSTLSDKVIDPADRVKVASVVCAQLLADHLALTDVGPMEVEHYYALTTKSQATEALNPLNEEINLDVDFTLETTRKFWMLRYFTVNPGNPARRKFSADRRYFETTMGCGIYVDVELCEFLNQYKNEIFSLLCILYDIVYPNGTDIGVAESALDQEAALV